MSRRAALLALALAAPALVAQEPAGEVIVAFGDSITEGALPFDEQNIGGYPTRLQRQLRQEDREATVRNRGLGGETTSEGLSRLGAVLAEGGDILLLMEGSNDVDLIVEGALSPETVRSNLGTMAGRARQAGFDVVLATLIPRGPNARHDQQSGATLALNLLLRELAFQSRNPQVDAWEAFYNHPRPYSRIYYTGADDHVGHPNAAGFDVLAAAFADVLQERDTMTPVIGEFAPTPPLTTEVRPGEIFEVMVYDFGAGLDRDALTLTLNDVPVATEQAGNDRRRLLSHRSDATTVTCFARLGVQAADRADPVNTLDMTVADFSVPGETVRRTDVNRDCRVDGRDVVALGRVFGLPHWELRFDEDFDVNSDGRIDGDDLARVARDFGRTTF